ncbi:hypothetical protein [Cohnella terricola]|uniref:Phosphodiester glycosidase domain-containing protein n=1 Tax=Cohnella terricola TaxID=1289167 RepID=A0A559JTS4_9BACL|nr:hypothetical protein [Cohnella terricola]TVY03284.1 hypothetical protein FPZ45_05255 [Cohnella terricola]
METATKAKIGIAGISVVGLGAIILSVVFILRGIWGTPSDDETNMPRDYKYDSVAASNGMELHYLLTQPSNIELESVSNNLVAAPFYGINGGFFYDDALLSIAVMNDVPVHKEIDQFGSGAANVKYARGTLVWDGELNRFSVQVVRRASEIEVSDRARYWAQGGISMSLDRSESWTEQAAAEAAPLPDQASLRSAAVYDEEGNLYLIVSTTKGTLAAFREAIVEKIGDGRLVNGIFLDGDGSSQLRCREVKLRGDGRPVVQMISLLQ